MSICCQFWANGLQFILAKLKIHAKILFSAFLPYEPWTDILYFLTYEVQYMGKDAKFNCDPTNGFKKLWFPRRQILPWNRSISPAKHSFGKCDRKVWQTDRQTDGRWTKWSLCVAMLRRRHNKIETRQSLYSPELSRTLRIDHGAPHLIYPSLGSPQTVSVWL